MKSRELMHLENTGHQGINSIFSKAHSADWDIDRDVDWVRRNAAALGEDDVVLIEGDALAPPLAPIPAAIAFLDPPYGLDLAGPALGALGAAGWIGPETAAIVETARGDSLEVPAGFSLVRRRNYGASQLSFLNAGQSS